nr:hypothetical protein [uncultured Celeribacter sp.]
MSAPDTDLEIQKKRHPVPLAGIALAVVVGLLIVVAVANLALDPSSTESTPVLSDQEVAPLTQ